MDKEREIEKLAELINNIVGTNLGQIHGTKSGFGKDADVTTTVDTKLVAQTIIEAGYHTNNNSTIKTHSDNLLQHQTKTWFIDQIRLLEQSCKDYEWQINNQAKNYEKLLAKAKHRAVREFVATANLLVEMSNRKNN